MRLWSVSDLSRGRNKKSSERRHEPDKARGPESPVQNSRRQGQAGNEPDPQKGLCSILHQRFPLMVPTQQL